MTRKPNFAISVFFMLMATMISCKKPYDPPVISSNDSFLVVEGVINSGSDSTFIKLSRTINISGNVNSAAELHAVLTVESDQNAIYSLKETKNGYYVTSGLNLNNANKYRLRIKTANNEQYLSDFVAVLNSPPIDSVNFTVASNGINVYSNTHDATNNTRYYRWDYQETWIFHSNYSSSFISDGHTIINRDLNNNEIYSCWATDSSSTIILNSSAKLAKDIISNNPVTFVSSTSEKLGTEYSIMVRQYALTGDAFKFWQNLKKNTEQLGSIFDAEPSQINGNMHCISTPAKTVIGYISVGSTSSQRIFIQSRQLPAWLPLKTYPDCILDTFLYKFVAPGSRDTINQVNSAFNFLNGATNPPPDLPIDAISLPGKPPIGYTGSTRECVDCTLRGTNKEPVFWKY